MDLFTIRDERLGESEKHFEGTIEEALGPVLGILAENQARGTLVVEEDVDLNWEEI